MRSESGRRESPVEHQQPELPASPPLTNHETHSAGQSPLLEGMAQLYHPSRHKARAAEPQRPRMTPQDSSSSTQSKRIARIEELSRRFITRQDKVTRSRGRVLKMRDRLLDGLASFRHHQRHLQESQQAFMNEIDFASTLYDPASRRAQIRELYEATHLDQCVLDSTTKKLHEIENRLGGLENVLKKREEKLQAVAHEMQEITETGLSEEQLRKLDSDLASETSDGSMHTYQSSVTNTPAAILEYWDRKGEVRVMRERLANVEMDYHEARANRNFEEDQEKPQEQSEEDFSLFWKAEIGSTQEELQRALVAFHSARQACISAGLVPFVGKNPPENDYDEEEGAAGAEAAVDPSLITITADHGNNNPNNPPYLASPHSPGFPAATGVTVMDRVSEWIQPPPGYAIVLHTPDIQEHPQFLDSHPDPPAPKAMNVFGERVADWLNETFTKPLQTREATMEVGWRASTPQFTHSVEALDDYKEQQESKYMELYLNQVNERKRLEWTDTRAYMPPRSVSDSCILNRLEK